eukprot:TRINITY_DN69034_c0_g1_i1.p1 TRINITY_DN69034_c0_g1~~TRINITY_DN69034_c0_g1_i1.p1  ORF type:complete len:298 (-),score=12.48 TRINITY_DN69034_c0_g1_i1:110-970(-)
MDKKAAAARRVTRSNMLQEMESAVTETKIPPNIIFPAPPPLSAPQQQSTTFSLLWEDSIDFSLTCVGRGLSPLVVIPAQGSHPSGPRALDGTLEATFFRRCPCPNTFSVLENHNSTLAVYNPGIPVLKGNERGHTTTAHDPDANNAEASKLGDTDNGECTSGPTSNSETEHSVPALACLSLRIPHATQRKADLHPQQKQILINSLQTACRVTQQNNHNVLVLTGIGVGSSKLPPQVVAAVLAEVLKKEGHFCDAVVFCLGRQSGAAVQFAKAIAAVFQLAPFELGN